jgi:hypothetical protein
MPSARTSVGNKEYEYKDEDERVAQSRRASNHRGMIHSGDAAMCAALLHVVDRTARPLACQHLRL